jgi:hypothetical protein
VVYQRYPEARQRRSGARWRGRPARWRGGEEGDDKWGPGVSGGEREGAVDGMREVKEKTYFAKIRHRRARAGRLRSQWAGAWNSGLGRSAGQGRWGLAGPAEAEAQWGEAGWLGRKLGKENKRICELKSDF